MWGYAAICVNGEALSVFYFENSRKRLGDSILLPNVNKGTAGHNSDSANLTDHVLFQHQRVA